MKRLMAVDDSKDMRKLLNITFSCAGYDVIEASDGNQALQKLNQSYVDIIVTDLNMPNMNGVDLIKKVRCMPGYHSLPIVMLTSEPRADMKKAAKAAGVSGWVTKPFKHDHILSIVKKCLSDLDDLREWDQSSFHALNARDCFAAPLP